MQLSYNADLCFFWVLFYSTADESQWYVLLIKFTEAYRSLIRYSRDITTSWSIAGNCYMIHVQ